MRGAPVLRAVLRGYARSRLVRRLVNAALVRAMQAGRAQGATLARLRPGVQPDAVRLGPLGYAAAARESFAVFSRLKADGLIPRDMRFQVCLPTPLAVISNFPLAQQRVLSSIYEARLKQEIEDMLDVIPADELAIQWDAAIEFAVLEGLVPSAYGSPFESRQPLLDAMLRLGNFVPGEVELGYHLCYGDAGHKHFKEPTDTARLVDVANAVAQGLQRRLNWLHFPVPIGRFDDAYYAPLRISVSTPTRKLYAGLVHDADGAAGTRLRIAAADRALGRPFGVATECGLGRRDRARFLRCWRCTRPSPRERSPAQRASRPRHSRGDLTAVGRAGLRRDVDGGRGVRRRRGQADDLPALRHQT